MARTAIVVQSRIPFMVQAPICALDLNRHAGRIRSARNDVSCLIELATHRATMASAQSRASNSGIGVGTGHRWRCIFAPANIGAISAQTRSIRLESYLTIGITIAAAQTNAFVQHGDD
jgi:hypothetical protein